MKKKLILIITLFLTTILLTGCTSYVKDKDKNVAQNEKTGQKLVENILCQPEAKSTIEAYEKHKVNLKKLPKCNNFNITSGGYEGVWNTIFVKPLAWIIILVKKIVSNTGLAIIIVTLLIRSLMIPVTKKAAVQSENLKKVQPELQKLEKKYKNKTDQESVMQKSQEMMILYKKYDINPMSGCLFSFIQIPLFVAFYEALYRLPAVFEGNFLNFNLGNSPLIALSNNNPFYLIFPILVFIVTYYSFKLNSGASMSPEQESQMKTMRNISLVMIGTTSFSVSCAISLYWITNSTFTILQNLYVKRIVVK